jgi:hypothetical protein
VRVAGGGRTFVVCRAHRPQPPVGPFGLSGQPPVSDRGHPAHRIEARARSRAEHATEATGATGATEATEVVHAGRPRLVGVARTRTTTTSGRRRRTARGVDERPVPALRPEPVEPIELPALEGTQRTARAALASLAAHAPRPPQGRARR